MLNEVELVSDLGGIGPMHSSMIGKIAKAKLYSHEPNRLKISGLQATFRGDHDSYILTFAENKWECACHYFQMHDVCSHVMAVENLLSEMMPQKV